MKSLLVVLFCLFVDVKSDYCQDNFTLSELPEGILGEALSLFTTGVITNFLGCPENNNVQSNNVKLWLFTRNNPTVPILLDHDNPKELNPPKKTIVLAPGWLCNVTNDRMPELIEAYLKRYDAYIIGIDWTAYSIDLYTSAFCNIPAVTEIIGKFLCNADTNFGIRIEDLHMVGHSMGGQIAGLTGQEVKLQCNKTLGRITGLDPAGPLYQFISKSRRLDKSDAKMVDVIHTNMLLLGFYGKCGTVDFYPNCFAQNGCFVMAVNSTVPDNILNLPLSDIGCNHLRSIDYMVESINSNKFNSRSCQLCPDIFNNPIASVCVYDAILGSTAQMGEDCSPNTANDKYYLTTKAQSPFAKG